MIEKWWTFLIVRKLWNYRYCELYYFMQGMHTFTKGGSSQKLMGGHSIWGSFNDSFIIIDYNYNNGIVQYSIVQRVQYS